MKNDHSVAGKIAMALGKGIIAGLAGTVAISIAQMIEMKITGREGSDAPAEAVNKVLNVDASDEAHKEQLCNWCIGRMERLGVWQEVCLTCAA